MSNVDVFPCVHCKVNAAHIFLCGEGYYCSECMAALTDEPEEKFFDDANVTDEIRSKARQTLREDHPSHD